MIIVKERTVSTMKKIGRFLFVENATDVKFLKKVSPTAKAKVPCYVEYNADLDTYLWIGNNIIKTMIEEEIKKLIENYEDEVIEEEEMIYLIDEYERALRSGL